MDIEYHRKVHSVYLLTYHIVFVTKYRRPVISDEIGDLLKDHAAYICCCFDGEMLSAKTDRDHIHMLVSMPPDVTPSKLVTVLKTQLSKEVRSAYSEEVRKMLWGDAFCSSSYFITTSGTTALEKFKNASAFLPRRGRARSALPLATPAIRRRLHLSGGLTPATETKILLTAYRGGSLLH